MSEKDGDIVSLILCFECGRKISEYADVCPGCGYVLRSRPWKNASDEHIECWLLKQTGWKWRVIGREDLTPGRALVLTEDILEARPLDDGTSDAVSWEQCSLRRYLNGPFFDRLPAEVRQRVVRIHHGNGWANGASEDRVFLLSKWEVEIYLKGIDRGGSVAADDEDDHPEPDEGRRSPLEAWQEDSRQYSKSLYDEWQEERESVLKDEAWYQEHGWEAERDREEEQSYYERLHWEQSGWWLRPTGDREDEANASDYDLRGFDSRYQELDFLDRTGDSGPHRSGSCSFEHLWPSTLSGVRVALCVDVSSCLNPDLKAAAMKPDWRARPADPVIDDDQPF